MKDMKLRAISSSKTQIWAPKPSPLLLGRVPKKSTQYPYGSKLLSSFSRLISSILSGIKDESLNRNAILRKFPFLPRSSRFKDRETSAIWKRNFDFRKTNPENAEKSRDSKLCESKFRAFEFRFGREFYGGFLEMTRGRWREKGIGFSTEQLSLGDICRICERGVDVDCPNIRSLITDMPLAF